MRNETLDLLGYYRQPGVRTSAGAQAGLLAGLPADAAGLAAVTHGVLVHEHLAGLYGFTLPDERRDSVHLRRGIELLPWDCWGVMPEPGDPLDAGLLALFDQLAELTADPDASLAALRALQAADDRIKVPPMVRNAQRGREEPV